MSVFQLKTFADLVASIREELGVSSTDTTSINRIKRDINTVYSEIVARKRWSWLSGSVDLTIPAYINAGTASVTQNSASITLTVAPTTSKTGYKFAVDGYSEIYTIDSHAAGSTTVKLKNEFTGASNSAANFKIFIDRVALPTDCKETSEVWHDTYRKPVENVGRQEYRRITTQNPRNEGPAFNYYTGDYVDPSQTSSITSLPAVLTRSSNLMRKSIVFASAIPSAMSIKITAGDPVRVRISGGGHPSYSGDVMVSSFSTTNVSNDTITYTGFSEYTESATADASISIVQLDQEQDYDRYRELYIYPYLSSSKQTLHVDYYKDILPLDNDSDEPVIPYEDRIVLRYGSLHLSWSRVRNETEAARNYGLYEKKIAQMEGKWQDSNDSAILRPNKNYLSSKRNTWRKRAIDDNFGSGAVGGGSSGQATGTANSAAIFGNDGVLVASPSISSTELAYLDGVTSAVQTQIDLKAPKASPTFSGTITTPLTASRAMVTGASSELAVSATTSTEIGYVSGVTSAIQTQLNALTALALPSALTTVTLADNQASAATVVSYTAATYDNIHMEYSIKRGSSIIECGKIYISTDGTNASIAIVGTSVGTSGVTLTADVSGANLRLRYTSTSTGTAPSFKYTEQKWLA